MIYTPYQLRAIDAFQERTLAVVLHTEAQFAAISEKRDFCFLSQRPYCPECRGTGLIETYDRKQFPCSCPLGDMDDEERNEIWEGELMMAAEEN